MALTDPIPSTAADVFKRNVEDADRFINSTSPTLTTRLNYTKKTLSGIEAELDAVITAGGYVPVSGSFEAGGTVSARNEVLLYEADGYYYKWAGTLPKVVSAVSTPATAGGVGAGFWTAVGGIDTGFFATLTGTLSAAQATIATDKVGGDPLGAALPADQKVYLRQNAKWSIIGGALTAHVSGDYELTIVGTAVGGETFTVEQNADDVAKSGAINIKQFGAVPGGVVDNTNAINDALAYSGNIEITDGNYLISGAITSTDKDVTIICKNATVSGTGGFSFSATKSGSVSASDVTDGDTSITSALSCVVGDLIEISGTLDHSLYTPYRYTSGKFCALVTDVSGGVIYLDRSINFSMTSVTAAVVTKYSVNIIGLSLDSTSLSVTNAHKSLIDIKSTGSVDQALSLNQCADAFVRFNGENLNNTSLGIVLNDCNNLVVDVIGNNIGKYDGSGTKAIRGNGLQNVSINAVLNSSPVGDSTIYGSRNITMNIISSGGGKYYRDNSITTSNRLESVQFSECDDVVLYANMKDVDDQAIEFLSCYRTAIHPKIHTLQNSTEGAIVIKGGSVDTTVINPVIRCNNLYAIKIECTDGQATSSPSTTRTNTIRVVNPDIVGTQSGVYVRDTSPGVVVDVNGVIEGGRIEAQTPVVVTAEHNYFKVKGAEVVTTLNHAIQGLADYLEVSDVECKGCNDISVRAVVSSGENDIVNRVTSDGAIYARSYARFNFDLARYQNNIVPRIYIDGDAYSFYILNNQIKVSSAPTLYTIPNGTILYSQLYTAGAGIGWACVNGGSNYPAWVTSTAYVLGQKVNSSGNVYVCVIAGTSGGTPPSGTGTGISDGGVTWDYVSAYDTYTLQPFGIVRQRAIGTDTITAGNTSKVVTHNLGITPIAWNASSNRDLTGGLWIDTLTSTQMTINIPSALGSDLFVTFWAEG